MTSVIARLIRGGSQQTTLQPYTTTHPNTNGVQIWSVKQTKIVEIITIRHTKPHTTLQIDHIHTTYASLPQRNALGTPTRPSTLSQTQGTTRL
jgi:dolichyl-phosphate-mannose--protein O-mannosyl transferase